MRDIAVQLLLSFVKYYLSPRTSHYMHIHEGPLINSWHVLEMTCSGLSPAEASTRASLCPPRVMLGGPSVPVSEDRGPRALEGAAPADGGADCGRSVRSGGTGADASFSSSSSSF